MTVSGITSAQTPSCDGVTRVKYAYLIPAFIGMTWGVAAQAAPVNAPLPWHTQAPQVESATADPVSTLRRIERYLNDIKTITADFTQVAPDGALASGKLYLERPGKMRWQYNPPTPILMVSSGKTLTYYDYELNQVSQLPLESTLAAFLAKPDIKFDDDALRVVHFREGAKSIRFTLLQTKKQDEGTLTMEFSDKPLKLENLILTDTLGQSTHIKLSDARYDLPLDASLFTFENPNAFGRRSTKR